MLIAVTYLGCKRSESPTGPNQPNDLSGTVELMQQDDSLMKDASGVVVSLGGTSKTTITDKLGQWKFTGLNGGLYNVFFSKAQFGTSSLSLDFVPSDTLHPIQQTLYQIPDYYVSSVVDTIVDGNVQIHAVMSSPANYSRIVLLFVAKDSSVIDWNGGAYAFYQVVLADSSEFTIFVDLPWFYSSGYASGSVVYLVARACVGQSSYLDTLTGKLVWTSYNPNIARARFTLP